jgi:periplasmic protein TonB
MKFRVIFIFLIIASECSFCQNDSPGMKIPPPPPPLSKKNKTNKIYDKIEVEATFPGGDTAFRNFLVANLQVITDSAVARNIYKGTYRIILQFIIDKEGNANPDKADSQPKEAFLEIACMEMIKKSPQWIPAKQNDMIVKAYRIQPVTIIVE